MSKLTELPRRGKRIFQDEGLISLVRRGFPFLAGQFFRFETYYLYEHAMEDIRKLNAADFMPKIHDFTFKMVSTNQEADELEANGLEFRSYVINARERLDKGAIAFCVFIERELAHIGWVALTQQAKDSLGGPLVHVDLSNGEACTGGTWTSPHNRGTGLAVYVYFKRFQFLRERGKVVVRAAADTNNIASHRMHARFGPKRYAEARYLKILWWKWWKEKPLT